MANALHDYCCPRCGIIVRDVPVPIVIGAARWTVNCPVCEIREPLSGEGDEQVFKVQLEWMPRVGRMDAGQGATFKEFETTGPDGKLHRINSLHELRNMETLSEKMAANGEGQPMVWRDYSNDRSNKYDHAISKSFTPDDLPELPKDRQALRVGQDVGLDHGADPGVKFVVPD